MSKFNKVSLLDQLKLLTEKVNEVLHIDFHNIEINGDVITIKLLNTQRLKDELFSINNNKKVLKILRKSNRSKLIENAEFAFQRFGFYFIVKKIDIGSKGLWEIANEEPKYYQ